MWYREGGPLVESLKWQMAVMDGLSAWDHQLGIFVDHHPATPSFCQLTVICKVNRKSGNERSTIHKTCFKVSKLSHQSEDLQICQGLSWHEQHVWQSNRKQRCDLLLYNAIIEIMFALKLGKCAFFSLHVVQRAWQTLQQMTNWPPRHVKGLQVQHCCCS